VAAPIYDGSSDASHSKTIVLSNSPGISPATDLREDKTAEDEAVVHVDHQYQLTFQEQDKPEDAAVPQL
jgi:hypothetical protein